MVKENVFASVQVKFVSAFSEIVFNVIDRGLSVNQADNELCADIVNICDPFAIFIVDHI